MDLFENLINDFEKKACDKSMIQILENFTYVFSEQRNDIGEESISTS